MEDVYTVDQVLHAGRTDRPRRSRKSSNTRPHMGLDCASSRHPPGMGMHARHHLVADSPDNRKFPGYCATFVIQDLALQVLGCRPQGLGPTPNANWEAATVPVWPTTRWAGRWPPKQHIGDQSLKAFGEHWGEKNLPGKKGCPP